MRDLTTERNKLTVNDGISGSDIELYYRTPKASEFQGYMSKLVTRKDNKIKLNTATTRMEYGMKILIGFRDGDFGDNGVPISSDSQNPNYRENWKELVQNNAPDIVMTLAFVVFEGTKAGKMSLEFDEDIEVEEAEEVIPFEKKSTG